MRAYRVYAEYLQHGVPNLPQPQLTADKDIRLYMFLRLLMLFSVLTTLIWLQIIGVIERNVLNRSYILIGATFALTSALILFYEKAAKFRYFLTSQILYDVFFTTALIFYSNPFESIYTVFYMFNVIFAAILFRGRGAIVTAILCSALYALLNSVAPQVNSSEKVYSVLTVVTALLAVSMLSSRLFDELKMSQQKIGRLEALNDEIIDSLDSGLIAVDRHEKIERINRTAAQLFEMQSVDSAYGKHLTSIFPILSTNDPNHITEFQINERQRRVVISKVELPESHKMYLIRDLTDVLELEEKLRRQERLAAVGQLAAGIAHEVRNPVASISGAAQLLSNTKDSEISSEERVRLIELIIREGDRIDRLIVQLLRFAKPSEHPRERFRLDEIIESAREAILARTDLVQDSKITVSGETKIEIIGYRDQWYEVITNLLTNALQAGAKKIEIIAKSQHKSAEVVISDDGKGIDSKVRSRIFDPFFTTKAQGTGLGLAHVHRVVREHDGQIDVESQLGRGTRMKIRVPLAA
ncbi:MAG TPA: ATP-binding protein [Oligoflexia bacterium]|nr:ATP-binding protein [Oligoflexia bacterium]